MRKIRNIWVKIFVIFIFFSSFNTIADETTNLTSVTLPKGVSLEIPNNWVKLSGDQRISLDSTVESVLDLSGIININSALPFAANYFDDKGETLGMLNVRYYPQLELTQADAKAANDQDVEELDALLKQQITSSIKAFNTDVKSWEGTQKQTINGITVFTTEYHRNSLLLSGEFRVRLVRVLAGDRSYTLTVSYNEAESFILKPITEKIINSMKLEGVKMQSSISPPSLRGISQTDTYSKSYAENLGLILLVSFLVTWALGLTPVILLRYIFLRRPISKKYSTWIVACYCTLFWIAFRVINAELGEKPGTGAVWITVFFIARWVLSKDYQELQQRNNL